MLERYDESKSRLKELETLLSDSKVFLDRSKYQELAREHASLRGTVGKMEAYRKVLEEIEEVTLLQKDPKNDLDLELTSFLKGELERLQHQKGDLELEIRADLLPHDKNEGRNVIVEIRSGAGGDEASIFAADLFRLYDRYAQDHGWKLEPLSSSPTGLKGFKEIIFSVEGPDAYRKLRFESGVHRVQRVPVTEGSGRIHTSTVTVAVLPEAEDIEIEIKSEDLRIDVFRSSGPGGQSVNTTDSAVRIFHIPSGITISCQDEKSQHKNKAKGLRVLRARLKEKQDLEEQIKLSQERKSQIGTGERSEKIRTYNFPQNRVTDHRIGFSLYNLQEFMEGKIEPMIQALLNDYINTMMKI
ncbi:MAG: peptide chain release factor 1 [Chlamydiae bacterium]|nr:peptide chain release factor 1 [Chlamydiota bacterium]MBI3277799.1 peptide chain release factor 1 [Chlamydiota bacterium]